MASHRDDLKCDAIILDLGGVILNLDFQLTLDRFLFHIPHLDLETFLGREKQLQIFSDFEVGRIGSEEFLSRFNEHHQTKMSSKVFAECWNAMILDLPLARMELIRRLGKKKRLFLLSNINEIHEEALLRYYSTLSQEPFSRLFERVYFSHLLGMRKPDLDVFQHLIDENGLEPERTLFIDDSHQHIQGASKTGIQAIHLAPPHSLDTLLNSLHLD